MQNDIEASQYTITTIENNIYTFSRNDTKQIVMIDQYAISSIYI